MDYRQNRNGLSWTMTWAWALCLVLVLPFTANPAAESVEDDCSECNTSESEPFPLSDSTDREGFMIDGSHLLYAWKEATRGGMITGYRLRSPNEAQPHDVYFDESGEQLTPEELAFRRVVPKTWDVAPLEAQPERNRVISQPRQPPVRRPVLALRKNLSYGARIDLPPLDLARIALEDESQNAWNEKLVRIGVYRDLPEPVLVSETLSSAGDWLELPQGQRLWSLIIHSPQAMGQRIHFSRLSLPSGTELLVYNPFNPSELYHPLSPSEEKDLWSQTCFSDTVVIECVVPKSAIGEPLQLEIDQTIHIYTDFTVLPWRKAAGECNLDVSCHPEWASIASGVGGVATLGEKGLLWCSGSLVVDSDPASDIPYFLTANHCVGSQSGFHGASTVEVYWLYQTDSCEGAVPIQAEVPRTLGGADLLASVIADLGTDFSLIRLREAPPEGLTYLGWSTVFPDMGSGVTGIHHPRSDYKRISFGSIMDRTDLQHEVIWYQGTTEGGSSGSPLLSDANQLIIGQLWGGLAACFRPEESDFYGRFDLTFPIIQQWLAPGHVPWDIDFSGQVNSNDIQLVINAALGGATPFSADVDESGAVDAVDVQLVLIALMNEPTKGI